MNINLKSIYLIYFKPKAVMFLVTTIFLSGVLALVVCRNVPHRYAMTALVKVAELGAAPTTAASFSPFATKPQSTVGAEAVSYLEFQYLSRGNKDGNGVRLVDAKEVKTSDTIQLVAEGPSMEAIQSFYKDVLIDLQSKYKPQIDSVVEQGTQQVTFLSHEIDSLETLKTQVENGIGHVGPAPALVSQVMEINQNLVKLKEEFFIKSNAISEEKIHNFKLSEIHALQGGSPIFPKTKAVMSFAMLVTSFISAYGIFLFSFYRKRNPPKPKLVKSDIPWDKTVLKKAPSSSSLKSGAQGVPDHPFKPNYNPQSGESLTHQGP